MARTAENSAEDEMREYDLRGEEAEDEEEAAAAAQSP
jgi:hypothetical protein